MLKRRESWSPAALASEGKGLDRVLATRPILIIEDDKDTRAALRDVLETVGFEVVEAADGRKALEWVLGERGFEPCLILLDLGMPVMSGWEFLAIIRNHIRLASIPVLVVSGQPAHTEAIAHGAIAGHAPKPIRPERLVEMVTRHVRAPAAQ